MERNWRDREGGTEERNGDIACREMERRKERDLVRREKGER